MSVNTSLLETLALGAYHCLFQGLYQEGLETLHAVHARATEEVNLGCLLVCCLKSNTRDHSHKKCQITDSVFRLIAGSESAVQQNSLPITYGLAQLKPGTVPVGLKLFFALFNRDPNCSY